MSIPLRRLGSQGLTVSAEGLGTMGMTAMYGTPDDAESVATIHRALEPGVTQPGPRPVLDQDAAELGVTPSQLAIAWVLGQGEKVAPIPGTKRRRYLEENVAAATLDLDPSIVARLSSTIAPGAAAGQRYAFMGTIEE